MKRSDYFYSVLLLGIVALIIYGFLNYFWVMAGLVAFSSVFSFMIFLFQTKINPPVANTNEVNEPVDFYQTKERRTYYKTSYYAENETEYLKQANAD